MGSLLDLIQQQIGDGEIRRMSRGLDADEDQVRKATDGALPLLVSALARNAEDPGEARSLAGALDRDHDGSLLDQVSSFLGQGDAGDGFGILGHVLGGRQQAAERGVAQASGLDMAKVGRLLALLAPVVMAALGKMKREHSMGAGDLAGLLGREREGLTGSTGGQDLISSILDADQDGQVMDDALELGKGLLGRFFKKRR
jgi:hypothetical protein